MTSSESYSSQIATQAASLSILPLWYPFFAKSVYKRSQIIESLSPSTFFKNKRNYYKGLTANLAMQPLFPLTDWALENLLEKIQQATQREPNAAERIFAGFITGTTTVAIANPYGVTVIASQRYQENAYKAFKRVINSTGVKGLYTGSFPMAIRNGSFVSSLLVTTPDLQEKIKHLIPGSGKAYNITTMVLASTLPAATYIFVAAPLDLMANMRQSDPSCKLYSSALHTLKAAYQKHGKGAFKVGLGNRLLACTIEMAGFNLLKNYYSEELSKSK